MPYTKALKDGGTIAAVELRPAGPVSEWVESNLNFRPDPVQAQLLNSRSKRVILNCTRQWGKSTLGAAKAVHEASMVNKSLTLVMTPSARQSAEFLRTATAFAQEMCLSADGDGNNELSLAFRNESRIVAVPATESAARALDRKSVV